MLTEKLPKLVHTNDNYVFCNVEHIKKFRSGDYTQWQNRWTLLKIQLNILVPDGTLSPTPGVDVPQFGKPGVDVNMSSTY